MTGDDPGGKADETIRTRLLQAATHEFARKGYAATTVRELVAACGVTKPVVYYHFGSKEGVYLALMQEAFAIFDRTLREALSEGGTARARIERLHGRLFALMLENSDVLRVIHSIYYGPPQGAPAFDFDAYHLTLVQHLRELVEEGMRSGEFRLADPETVTWALIGALSVAEGIILGHQETGFGAEEMRHVLGVVFDGVLDQRVGERESGR
jgi:AcrR family transcriptional regulator